MCGHEEEGAGITNLFEERPTSTQSWNEDAIFFSTPQPPSSMARLARTRFPWNPDCGEEHDPHEPTLEPSSSNDEELYCEVCGHGVEVVVVHLYEMPVEDERPLTHVDNV